MKSWTKAVLISEAVLVAAVTASPAWAGGIKGKVAVQGIRSAENIAVYVDAIPGKDFPAPAQHVVMDQKDLKFVPHILPVLVGTTVDFMNSDPVAHNVFSPDGEKYNLGTWPQGATRAYTFKQAGVYAQLCHVHPEMEGFIVVLQNPYFVLAGEDGKYELKNVPVGSYTLVAWNEKMEAGRVEVTVRTGETTPADIELKRK